MYRLALLLVLSSIATSAAHAQGAGGEWDGTLNTPGAAMPWRVILTVKGDSLRGTVVRASGDVPLTGTVRGDSVFFRYTIQYGDNPFLMALRGQVQADTLRGIVDFGGGFEETFLARRVPPARDSVRTPARR